MSARNDITRFTLPNGLRVVHLRMDSTAMVALNVLYDTGARDEQPTLTGIAHLFEHLMFGGSANAPDYDGILTAAGGENNAWTSNDFTNFYNVAPAHNAETLFFLESDRMLAPSLSQHTLDVQKAVVIEEFKQQCLNRPYGDSGHHLRSMVYGTHPYSWPVIGKSFEQIESVTRGQMIQWWQDHYSPANAVLAITGNISAELARQYTEKWFGPIPARASVPRNITPAPPIPANTFREVSGNVPATAVTVAYLMDPYGTPAYTAADAITDLLAAGNASRFYRRLIVDGDGTFTDCDASILGSEHQGMLMLNGRLADESSDPRRAARMLIDMACTAATEPVSDHDLTRLKNKFKATSVMSCMDYLGMGQRLAMAEMHHESIDTPTDRYLALTPRLITETARHIFLESEPAVLVYRPAQSQEGDAVAISSITSENI